MVRTKMNSESTELDAAAKAKLKSKSDSDVVNRSSNKLVMALIGLAICGIIAYLVFDSMKTRSVNEKLLVSGRIEAPETYISSATATRVQSVNIKEGDHVRKGQLILTLDASSVENKLDASGSAIAMAQSAKARANAQIAATQNEINTAKKKSKGFFAKIFTSKKKKEEVKAHFKQEMTEAQILLQKTQMAELRARAIRAEASSKLSYFYLKSPIDGVCTIRSVQPGELVAAGQILLTISDPKSAFMKGYIPEGKVGEIKVGQPAIITLDSNHKLKARITAIDTTPTFTPENVYFKEDRVRQVFGLKLTIDHNDGSAKAGMPAEAEVQRAGKKLESHK